MDWNMWKPDVRSALCYIRRGDEVLLIRKKRGWGAGKISGPGGKLEPGESAEEAAVRETREETGVTPHHLRRLGDLHFQYAGNHALQCAVFLATNYEGNPRESDEAAPFWARTSKLPLDQMWEDDRYWLPDFLEGKSFRAYFEFDGDRMLSHRIEWEKNGEFDEKIA